MNKPYNLGACAHKHRLKRKSPHAPHINNYQPQPRHVGTCAHKSKFKSAHIPHITYQTQSHISDNSKLKALMFALRHVFCATLKPSKTRADKFQCQKHANLHTRNQNNHTKVAHGLKQRNLFRSPKVACPLNSRLGGLGLAILRPEALGWLASWASQQFSPEWKLPRHG